jgi:hypothetical protein
MFHAHLEQSEESIIPMMGFLVYFVAMELFTICVDYKNAYFKDVWNTLDFLFLALLAAYIYLFIMSEEKQDVL